MTAHRLKWIMLCMATIILASVTAACDDSQTDGPSTQLLQQIVSFTGNSDNGRVGFQYRAVDDSPLVTLWAPGRISEKDAKPGDRLLLTYRLDSDRNPAEGGEVMMTGLQRILTDTVATAPAPVSPGGLFLLTIQRSGQYLDIAAMMPQTTDRSITLTATSTTPDAEGLIDLTIDATAGKDADQTYMAQAWASLWIGPVWTRSDVSGVRVRVNNTNNPYRSEFTFKKTTIND